MSARRNTTGRAAPCRRAAATILLAIAAVAGQVPATAASAAPFAAAGARGAAPGAAGAATAAAGAQRAAAGAAAAAAGARGVAGAQRARPGVVLQTPVLSLRRVPELVAYAVAVLRLGPVLDAALATAGPSSCLLVRQGALVLYSRRPSVELIPASNLKLFTATAALDRMGSDARLVTGVRADHPPAGGTVAGNLYLVGGGDPLLRTADYVATLRYREVLYSNLDTLAQQVRAAGVTRVTGGVVGDESRYDTQRYVATWKPSYAATGEVGPLSALQVNDGFESSRLGNVASAEPAVQAARVFTSLLRRHGVVVDGPPIKGSTPAAAVQISSLASPPLVDTLAEVLRQSDNNGAELIAKELGRRFGAAPTTAAGVAVTRSDLQSDGLPVDQLAAVDGSGLDRADRASCQLVLDTLTRGGPHGPLAGGLPVAGQSGTLENRLRGTPAAGRLRAKTGNLAGVSALSGFVDPAPTVTGSPAAAVAGSPAQPSAALTRQAVAFAMILNDEPSMAAGAALADRVGVILAEFPQAPPPDQLAPLPVIASA